MKWTNINNGDSGLSVRTKLNDSLSLLLNLNPIEVNSNYSLTPAYRVVYVTTGVNNIEITLPLLSNSDLSTADWFVIFKVDSGSGRVTVKGAGADTIMGQSSIAIRFQYEFLRVIRRANYELLFY